ncbi:Transcriptional regulator, GntR family domain / Aspartate aminotransferase [hydrothermal vent metagenome]|uniref:Transcriptional regulator, GntR family domain / Aspartate aminotransferase n=1 Tax=hydrothermal vent metagenome TaxID=652676 RepID=A0A3B1CR86_9ZZZZ
MDESLEHYISLHIDDNSSNLLTELKSIFAKISKKSRFVLLIDDIGNTSPRILETFTELFPILQANNIKIIVTQNNDSEKLFSQLENEIELSINAFSEEEVIQLINSSYQDGFHKDELKKLVLSYADRNPKNIADFIFNMIVSGVIDYTYKGVKFNLDPDLLDKMIKSQDFIYEKMYKDLLQNELIVLEIISLFKGEISVEIISKILGTSKKEINSIITSLRSKNVIKSAARNLDPLLTNDGFKKYIYQNIKDKKALHFKTAQGIKQNSVEINSLVFAEQFELADRYDLAKEVIDEAIENPLVNVFSKSLKELLERKLSYKLTVDDEIETLKKLISVFVDIGEFLLAESHLKKLEKMKLDQNSAIQKNKLLGITLINLGELSKGLKILKTIANKIEKERNNILFEMASAHLELNEFKETGELCNEIISAEKNDHELLGRVYNLMGLSALYNNSELNEVMEYFNSASQEYNKINNLLRIASIEVNIGNISFLMGNFSEAEKHWNKALQINQSIGNVSQEAQILLNYGVFNYERAKYEKAVELYQQAGAIFKGLGNKKDLGLVLTNLGETYLAICEYQFSYDSLIESQKIFKKIKNEIELTESLMLLAKLFWVIGNRTQLHDIIQKINKLNINNDENISVQFSFIKRISGSISKLDKNNYSELTKVIEESKSINQKRIAFDIQFIIMNLLLDNGIIDGVQEVLEEEDLLEFCKNNSHFDAKRLMIMFKLSTLKDKKNDNLEKPIVYLKRALKAIESQSITEDTISILYNLAMHYKDRGNISKTDEYADLYFAILEYVIDNIKSRKLKNSYLENPKIKNYLFSYKNLKY